MNIVIIGGGYLGQLLHTLLPMARVLDWRTTPPKEAARSFGPQYLWTPILSLPCERFQVITYVDDRPATPEAVKRYKEKVGKELDQSDWRMQFRTQMDGFEAKLPEPRIEYGMRVTRIDRGEKYLYMSSGETIAYDWIISTIPLPNLLQLCGMTVPKDDPFTNRPIYVWTDITTPLSYLFVNYVSDPSTPVYRVTIRNGRKHSESLVPITFPDRVTNKLLPGKIYPHSLTSLYRAELMQARILTVGRYGAWDPEELAHETYAHVRDWKDTVGL
jgi:hypothetical protein